MLAVSFHTFEGGNTSMITEFFLETGEALVAERATKKGAVLPTPC